MLFSYYFDSEKTHLLNCQFRVLQFTELAAGVIDIMFAAEITELQNGIRLKRETKVASFSFPPTPEGQVRHDIDFTRVRYAEQKKWIFTVMNNKEINQRVEVGLISNTANKNPLGMDVYHTDEQFNVELKANNLSILEPNYIAPVLTQTVASTAFDNPGYPERFSSYTASYDNLYRNFTVRDFVQDFSEPIPVKTKFKVQMDIAPTSVTPLTGSKVFDVTIPNFGKIAVYQDSLEYMIDGGSASDIVRAFFDTPIQPEDFWKNGMTTKSKFIIDADGVEKATIRYNEKTLDVFYDASKTFTTMSFRGELEKI